MGDWFTIPTGEITVSCPHPHVVHGIELEHAYLPAVARRGPGGASVYVSWEHQWSACGRAADESSASILAAATFSWLERRLAQSVEDMFTRQNRRRSARGLPTRNHEAERARVQDLKRALSNPARVIRALELHRGAQRQTAGGWTIRCPWHEERTPSCSISLAKDRTLRIRCFGCGATADVLGLIAQVRGIGTDRKRFREVLASAESIASVCGG